MEFAEKVERWARLGQSSCGSVGAHELEISGREQKCRTCLHLFVSVDQMVDGDCQTDRLFDLLSTSPRQQTCAMDDSFLEDLDHANHRTRKLKRQSECLNNLQPRLGKYGVSHQPIVVKFKQNLKAALPVLFPKISSSPVEDSEKTPIPVFESPIDDILVYVKFEHALQAGHSLSKTVLSLPATATVQDVLEAVARKLITTMEQLHAEYSPRDLAGAFLGLDDSVRETVVLRARSLSISNFRVFLVRCPTRMSSGRRSS